MSHRHCILLIAICAAPGLAQSPPDDGARAASARGMARLTLPGGAAADAARAAALAGDGVGAWSLLRAPSLADRGRAGVRVIAPTVATTHNSEIPFSQNDGSAWAGRGLTVRAVAGVAAEWGPLRVVAAPEVAYAQNLRVRVVGSSSGERSAYASPWHSGEYSADLPVRFGTRSLTMWTTGQSRVELRGARVAGGVSSENLWWGPGIRNALVLSGNAPGIPHAFLRTARPLRSRLGEVEARWIAGALTESIYFDRDRDNDLRSISGLAATLRLAREPGLTLGVARVVYAPSERRGGMGASAFDVLTRWGQRDDSSAARLARPDEQLLALSARWAFPGVEAYGEWARQQLPRSFRDLLVTPHLGSGYTLGLQAARPARRGVLRGQLEVTNLEQLPRVSRGRVHTFYTSRLVPQGYTQRGQAIGAAIGPGASSQWIAADYLGRSWRIGANFNRVRHENDAYYQQPTGRERYAHDVSLMSGVRGGLRVRGVDLDAELIRTHRLNFLFQSVTGGASRDGTYDVYNRTLRLTASVAP